MKKILSAVLDYGPWVFFILIAMYGLVVPWINNLAYDERTYFAVLSGILVFLSLNRMDYVKAKREKRVTKKEGIPTV